MYDDVLPRYMVMHCLCAWCPRRPKEGDRSPETGIRDDCESPCGCWDLSARAASALNLNWAISQSVMSLSCKFKLTFILLLCDPVPLFAFWQLFVFCFFFFFFLNYGGHACHGTGMEDSFCLFVRRAPSSLSLFSRPAFHFHVLLFSFLLTAVPIVFFFGRGLVSFVH